MKKLITLKSKFLKGVKAKHTPKNNIICVDAGHVLAAKQTGLNRRHIA